MGQQTPHCSQTRRMRVCGPTLLKAMGLSHLTHTHTHTHTLIEERMGAPITWDPVLTQHDQHPKHLLAREHHSSPRETFLHISCLSPRNKRPLCPRAVKDWGLCHCQDRGQMQPRRMENLISASMGGLTHQIFLHRASVQQISA